MCAEIIAENISEPDCEKNIKNIIIDLKLMEIEKENYNIDPFKKIRNSLLIPLLELELEKYYINKANPITEYKVLHGKLINIFIEDISINDFNEIMMYKNLPNGRKKLRWIGKNKADAYRFSKKFDFTIKKMNDCFSFANGKLRANDNPKENRTQTELTKIFKELNL